MSCRFAELPRVVRCVEIQTRAGADIAPTAGGHRSPCPSWGQHLAYENFEVIFSLFPVLNRFVLLLERKFKRDSESRLKFKPIG